MRIAVGVLASVLCAACSPAAALGGIVDSERTISQRKIFDYWTPQRMAAASASTGVRDGAVAGASASKKEDLPKRAPRKSYVSKKVPDATKRPFIASGRIFGRTPGQGGFECSGTVVKSPNHSVVLTAAHCLNYRGEFADRLIFIPGYRNGNFPYGQWAFDRLIVPGGYPPTASPQVDYGAAVMAPQGTLTVEDAVGGRDVRTGTKRRQTYRALGYPVNKAKGERLWSCRSEPLVEINGAGKYPPVGIGCDMSFGASGGGWIGDKNDVVSVTSIGIEGYKDFIFGPRLRTPAKQLLADAGKN